MVTAIAEDLESMRADHERSLRELLDSIKETAAAAVTTSGGARGIGGIGGYGAAAGNSHVHNPNAGLRGWDLIHANRAYNQKMNRAG